MKPTFTKANRLNSYDALQPAKRVNQKPSSRSEAEPKDTPPGLKSKILEHRLRGHEWPLCHKQQLAIGNE
ncbi:MAG TPA: hypothetical protein VFY05_11205 [Candidatus Angelobacter sp.]|nr:hypothetical protein [Candidatus Angelobacter sp.]